MSIPSFALPKRFNLSTASHADLAFLLAGCIRYRREELGLSMERAAELAGLELSEWCDLENGWVPSNESKLLRLIAGALDACYGRVSFVAELSRFNQERLFSSPRPQAS
jgi:transcriptional regulator with XRE-family HTH domain